MSDYDGKNIFEKIVSFIPGYKGYSEMEGRRDTDKLLRVEITKHLDSRKIQIDAGIRQQLDQKKLELVGELDRIKRNLGLLADQIRYADYGYSGFFDIVQVNISDLDKLYQFDLGLEEDVEKLDELWSDGTNKAKGNWNSYDKAQGGLAGSARGASNAFNSGIAAGDQAINNQQYARGS